MWILLFALSLYQGLSDILVNPPLPGITGCIWSSQLGDNDGNSCRTHPVIICEIWRRLYAKHKDKIDKYTATYYEDQLCIDQCLYARTEFECLVYKFGDRPACNWLGSSSIGGACRGNALEARAQIVKELLEIDKSARFSYIINLIDCHDICQMSGLGVLPDQCPKLRDCCQVGVGREPESPSRLSFARCTYDNNVLATKYAPYLSLLASAEMHCKRIFNEADCLAVPFAYFKDKFPPF